MHISERMLSGRSAVGAHWLTTANLTKRQEDSSSNRTTLAIAFGVVAAGLVVFCIAGVLWRRRRMRKMSKNGALDGVTRRNGSRYHQASGHDHGDTQEHQLGSTVPRPSPAATNGGRNGNASNTVDRHASIRSVMTLPAYRQSASLNEQVLGREGERDGIDVIVDLPSEEQAEALRDEEMEALYQIRAARREQNAEQADLRRQRQEAEQRHDRSALADIRARTRTASTTNQNVLSDLRADAERVKDSRQRSVSSVSYGDLGVARHDGTRLRAGSNDSERMGLLSDAASIALSTRSGAHSPSLHRRDRSISSIRSFDSDVASAGPSDAMQDDRRRRSSSDNRAGSSPELIEADTAAESQPPPEYAEVSLTNEVDPREIERSTTPLEPPPDYSGPHRSASPAASRSLVPGRSHRRSSEESADEESLTPRVTTGTETIQVPEIVVQPSSAHPDHEEPRTFGRTGEANR